MSQIHPTAVIEPGAKIAPTVKIGPLCVVGPRVELGENVELMSHVAIGGRTTVGDGTRIFPFASIGHAPQDLKYKGEESRLEIGSRNIIREHVTMNPGTSGGGMVTRVGDDCLFMVGSHVAHDCVIGNHVIMANNATLAGHVRIEDYAVFGGLSAVHQFVRVGRYAMVGGVTGVERDVIPFGSVVGDRARLSGLNIVGMQRGGYPREDIQALRTAFQMLFGNETGTFAERLAEVDKKFPAVQPVRDVLDFARAESIRGLCQPKLNGGS
ncbi:MAG TPA: acyl-ACP--UDP-N-acetylglucosamine O-acyltransferase [Stellaceae bacterium]|nr:acyl-ACP--UDP-N-acetylglucosamine O-acyltransferase [Stellaceae bacterium]